MQINVPEGVKRSGTNDAVFLSLFSLPLIETREDVSFGRHAGTYISSLLRQKPIENVILLLELNGLFSLLTGGKPSGPEHQRSRTERGSSWFDTYKGQKTFPSCHISWMSARPRIGGKGSEGNGSEMCEVTVIFNDSKDYGTTSCSGLSCCFCPILPFVFFF